MKVKVQKIQGETLLEILFPIFLVLLVFTCLSAVYSSARDSVKFSELNKEIDSAFQKMAIGENKEKYLIKKADSSKICLELILKQKDYWDVIEVEDKIVDIKEKQKIYDVCSSKDENINIKFLNPIFKPRKE